MSFPSLHAPKIWDRLYLVYIPDQVTLNPDYIKKFGTHVTGNKQVDQMVSTNLTLVKIPIISILQYFEDGIEIQIPSRDDMITMHKDLELYLAEWRDHIKFDINSDIKEHKEMILSLEKLSKYIYNKAKPREIIDNLFIPKKIGLLVNPLQQLKEQTKEIKKPEYEGIGKLVKSKTKPQGRFG